jgi:hypothetical protein
MDDGSLFPDEIQAALELIASGERQYPIQPVGREFPELLGGLAPASVDDVMSTELPDQARRSGPGVSPSLRNR